IVSVFQLAYPDLTTLVARRGPNPAPLEIDIHTEWRDQARRLVDGLTLTQREHFSRIDPRAQQLLLDGDLNPSLIALALNRPSFYDDTLHPLQPKVAAGIAEMANQLARINRIAHGVGAHVVVVSVPFGAYVSQTELASRAELGFSMEPAMLSSDLPDSLIQQAAEQAGVSFVSVTDAFRSEAEQPGLYYEWDGHITPAGQMHFGSALVPLVEQNLTTPRTASGCCA